METGFLRQEDSSEVIGQKMLLVKKRPIRSGLAIYV
jgi:hypothetical protein